MFRSSRVGRIFCGLCVCALLVSTAWGQGSLPPNYTKLSQDGTPIPDVNKLNPANPLDSSCWLASASNILAAAGYGGGPGGAMLPAQQRANIIYGQLTGAYGTSGGGAPDRAISYWLAWYGKNPGSPDYQPALAYTDVTAKYAGLGLVDYNFLKSELYRCQYVGVQFENPAHAVTFVGWDDNLGQSIWTDSDRTVGPNGYDPYVNNFTPAWNLAGYLNNANGYVTFCPGLNKDPRMVANYDVAWAPSPAGLPMAREAGAKAGIIPPAPGWQSAVWVDPLSNATFDPFLLNNEADPLKQKHVELLVDYYGRNENYINEDIRLRYHDPLTGLPVIALPTSKELSADNGQVLFTWELDTQPAWEEILFPSSLYPHYSGQDYRLLEGKVASWDVATLCVPEPGTLVLLVTAGLGLLACVWRRRRN